MWASYGLVKLQQLPLGTARQQRGKWRPHDRIEHRLHGPVLSYFQEGMVRPGITQHLDELEQEAERKGGVLHTLADHFSKVYRLPGSAFAQHAA
jgi:hypothetical protein